MRVVKDINPLKEFTLEHRLAGRTLGLVPTMGALHRGHMTLIKQSLKTCDATICSIYVNPTQFDRAADLTNYPRTLEADLKILEDLGCQAAFVPEDHTMYTIEPLLKLDFGSLENVMEGSHRPGHFNGVGLVVSKLLHMVLPDYAFFGQKDWQQVAIIKQLVSDLSFPVKIIDVPIVREPDGLAMSSRNRRLTKEDRQAAPQLFQSLQKIKKSLEAGNTLEAALGTGVAHIQQYADIKLEYLEIVQSDTLQKPTLPLGEEPLSVCLAAFLGEIRLIDNVKVF